MAEPLGGLSDDELWAEVQRRQLVIQIGYVNPKLRNQYERGAYVLFDQTWQDRWPVFGLRGGDTIAAQTPSAVTEHNADDQQRTLRPLPLAERDAGDTRQPTDDHERSTP